MNQKFPIVITHEGVNAKIHRAYQIQNGKKYPGFIVVYQEKGKRIRIRRTALEEAKTAAENACHKISHGSHLIIELSESAKQTYLRAIEHTMPIGVSLDVAAAEYTTAINRLPQRATLLEAIDYYCRHNSGINDTRTVQQVVAEVLKVKTDAKLSAAYLFDLDTRLSRFSEHFQMNISDVTGSMIQEWLDKLKCKGLQKSASGRSKRNYLQMVSGVFYIGLGNQFDADKLQAYPPGAVIILPGNTSHFHWAKSGEYITQITAIGPLGIDYVNPKDDPRNRKSKIS